MTARLALVGLAVLLGCAAEQPQSPLPAGIAELQLPASAASLRRTAVNEEEMKTTARRTEILAGVQRQLLMAPLEDALVPEMFDFLVVLAPRMEAGKVSAAWGSYLYTTYQRELRAARPDGTPRRNVVDVEKQLDEYMAFYAVQQTPSMQRTTPEAAAFEGMQDWRNERRMGR